MTLWLITHIPTWGLALGMIGGITALAVLGDLIVRRRVPALAEGDNNEVAGVVLGIFGAIYGIVLAFVIVALWEGFQSTEENASAEATALAQIVRDSAVFPPEPQAEVRQVVSEYAHAVVEHEWPLMDQKRTSRLAGDAIDKLYVALQSYEPVTEAQKTFYGAASANLDVLISLRRERLHRSEHDLPMIVQVLIFVGAFITIALLYFFGMRSALVHVVMVGAVAALLAFNLMLTVVLDHPYSGDIAVDSHAFKEGVLRQFWPAD